MKIFIWLGCFFFFLQTSFAQSIHANVSLSLRDSLELHRAVDGSLKIFHRVGQRQTLYSISKFYHVEIDEIRKFNPILNLRQLSDRDTLIVPFHLENLSVQDPLQYSGIPVFYRVKPKETLFGIAKRYFKIPVPQLKMMNRLQDDTLSIDQSLFLGYFHQKNTIVTAPKLSMTKLLLQSDSLRTDSTQMPEDVIPWDGPIIENRGVAMWNKEYPKTGQLLAMHKTAKVNSLIEIANPMFGRKVFAKVVGNIPPNRFTPDIMLIVSPEVARKLGVLDNRFYASIRYVE